MKTDQPKKKKSKDPLFRMKFLGYHMSQITKEFSYLDFVRFAKFHLCVRNHRLMKDPIWKDYTPEDILVEFFAHQFVRDPNFKAEFEFNMEVGKSVVDDFAAWADREIAKNQKEREDVMGEHGDKVSFNPDDVMGEE